MNFTEFDDIETLSVEADGDRLDKYVSEKLSVSRSRISSLIDEGYVRVSGMCKKKNYTVKEGDIIEVAFPSPIEYDVLPENIHLDIVYEDNDLLIVNKKQGMVVHPAPGHYSGTLVNALMYHIKDLSEINGINRPGIVHRIDMNTSGLLIVAKNDNAHKSLSEQIKIHSFDRHYEAIVHGCPKNIEGDINYAIGRSKTDRKMMAAYPEGCTDVGVRQASTHFQVIQEYKGYAHIKLKLKTGRTHQIRVHTKAIGHPVVGDNVYTSPKLENFGLKGQCLHARSIGFQHPTTGEQMYFESELPQYFTDVLKKLNNR